MNGKFDITLSALGMPEEQLKRKKKYLFYFIKIYQQTKWKTKDPPPPQNHIFRNFY